jgi:ketosteroid isomerase-like protein
MSATVDRYFELVDAATRSKDQLEALIAIFADDGILTPADGAASSGKQAIREYLTGFYTNVAEESRHFYNTTSDDGTHVEADWVVSARVKQGGLVSLRGHNVFKISKDGRIQSLTVRNT